MSDASRLVYAQDVKDLAIKLRRTVRLDKYTGEWPCLLLTDINDVPTADAAPIVHAHWYNVMELNNGERAIATCSACKDRGEVRTKRTEYGFWLLNSPRCPNCGAVMDEGTR